jgi:hypothetical protein
MVQDKGFAKLRLSKAFLFGGMFGFAFARFAFLNAPLGLYDDCPWLPPFAGKWHKILDWVE